MQTNHHSRNQPPSSWKEPTGVAVLGCGYWGGNYVRVLGELPDARLVAVCDKQPSRLDEVRRRLPDVAVTTEVDEIVRMPEVAAVVICTEARTHYDMACRALRAGKHVLVEKPLAASVVHADRLIDLAEAERRVLLVGHTFLYNAGVRKVREYISNSELGRLYYLYAQRTNLGPIRRDVNAIWDLGSHDVAIFNYLLDSQPLWTSAVGVKVLHNETEDVGFISLGYPNGIVGHIHVSWADPDKVREVVVVGRDKRIVFNDLDPLERVRVFDRGVGPVPAEQPPGLGTYPFVIRDGDITSPAVALSEPLKNQLGHFLHCVRRGESPLTGGRLGRDVVEVMEAIDRSIALRGAPVTVQQAPEAAHEGRGLANALR
jgi:predicted dehydrogenase